MDFLISSRSFYWGSSAEEVCFRLQNSLYEWYWGYVYLNMFVYSNLNGEGPGLFERIYILSKLLYWTIREQIV